jgi:hypothetical protein
VLVYVGMKNHNPTQGENQGEGDRKSARRYNRDVREFVAEGRVDEAARDAAEYLEREPEAAREAEKKAARGPRGGTRVSVDELVAKGRTIVDRVKPYVTRAASRIRARLGRK